MRAQGGFTLIELLIVVVIIGLLAAIVIPKYAKTKEKSYVAAMKSDLKNLATAQESYFAGYVSYTTVIGNLEFNESQNVSLSLPDGDDDSWRATATHLSSLVVCELYYGNTTGSTATVEGVIGCS